MRSILFERLLESEDKAPKYGKNRGDVETKSYGFYHDEADVNHFDPNDDNPQYAHHYDGEDQRELEALVDSGEFAGEDPSIDTDDEWISKKTRDWHDAVNYDKRSKDYGLGTSYKGSKNTDAFSDRATKAVDDDYENELKRASKSKNYFTKQRYAKGVRMHSLRNPGGARPELVDYDPDSDPNVKWYD